MSDRTRSRTFGLLTILTLVLAGVAGWLIPHQFDGAKARGADFGAVMGLLLVALLFAGVAIKGTYLGVFIDFRGRVSLSRLQMAAWTVVVAGAWSTAVLINVANGSTDPGDVAIPGELLALMGISASTLFAATVVKSYNDSAHRLYKIEKLAQVKCGRSGRPPDRRRPIPRAHLGPHSGRNRGDQGHRGPGQAPSALLHRDRRHGLRLAGLVTVR